MVWGWGRWPSPLSPLPAGEGDSALRVVAGGWRRIWKGIKQNGLGWVRGGPSTPHPCPLSPLMRGEGDSALTVMAGVVGGWGRGLPRRSSRFAMALLGWYTFFTDVYPLCYLAGVQ
jgi:hypothetical protein